MFGGLHSRSLSSSHGSPCCISPNKTSSQVHQSEEYEECVPADCSNSSSTSVATTISTPVQTTLQTLFLTTTSAAPTDCLSILSLALSERYSQSTPPLHICCRSAEIQRSVEEGLTHGGIQARGAFFTRIQNELLFLGTQTRELERQNWESKSKKGLLGVQVREILKQN